MARAAPPPPVVTCGEPAGIGPEIAATARARLGAALPFAWIGDPAHLPAGTPWQAVETPVQAATVPPPALPVLVHRFAGRATPGRPDPAHAAAVVAVIDRAVALVRAGQAGSVVT